MTIRPVLLILAVATTAVAAHAYDPYESPLDQSYRSLGNSIHSAYSSNIPSYTGSSGYSYGSSSGNSSYSSSSSGSSVPLYDAGLAKMAQDARWERAKAAAAQADFYARKFAEEKRYDEAQRTKRELAEWEERQQRLRDQWNAHLAAVNYRDAKVRPPVFTTRSSEFNYWVSQSKGDPFAALKAGQMLMHGIGTLPDPAASYPYFAAAPSSWPETMYGLGVCLTMGAGTPQDARAGLKILTTAAIDRKFAPAALYLGSVYEKGIGVTADMPTAFNWYRRASWNGMEEAHYTYGEQQLDFVLRHMDHIDEFLKLVADDELGKYHEPFGTELEYHWQTYFISSVCDRAVAAKNGDALYKLGIAEEKYGYNSRPPAARLAYRTSTFIAGAELNDSACIQALFSPNARGDFFFLGNQDALRVKKWFEAQREQWVKEAPTKPAVALALASALATLATSSQELQTAETQAAQLPATMPGIQRGAVFARVAEGYLKDGSTARAATCLKQAEALGLQRNHDINAIYDQSNATKNLLTKAFNIRIDGDVTTLDLMAPAATVTPESRAKAVQDREAGLLLLTADEAIGISYLTKAAIAGDLPSLVRLYHWGKSNDHNVWCTMIPGSQKAWQEALMKLLEKAAEAGDGAAATNLGEIYNAHYFNSNGKYFGDVDNAKSVKWFTRAAELGDPAGQLAMAAAYESDYLLLKRDPAKAQAFRRAAHKNTDLLAKETLAWDFSATHQWAGDEAFELKKLDDQRDLEKRMASRHEELVRMLPELEKAPKVSVSKLESVVSEARYLQGVGYWWENTNYSGSEHDTAKAMNCFIESIEAGSTVAPLAISNFYAQGRDGFPKDPAIARRWQLIADRRLTILADSGNDWAALTLGGFLVDDNSYTAEDHFEWLPTDKKRGLKYIQAAALRGARLTSSYGDGEGMPAAFEMALVYREMDDKVNEDKWNKIEEWMEAAESPAQVAAALKKARALVGVPEPVSAPKATPPKSPGQKPAPAAKAKPPVAKKA